MQMRTKIGSRNTTVAACKRLLRKLHQSDKGAIVIKGFGWTFPTDLRQAAGMGR